MLPLRTANDLTVHFNGDAAFGDSEQLQEVSNIRNGRNCPGLTVDLKRYGFHRPHIIRTGFNANQVEKQEAIRR